MGFSWELDIFEQQGAWKRRETAVSYKKRTKQEIWISVSYSVFHSDRSKATIIDARENVYGHAGRITTCFLTLGQQKIKNLCYISPSNESSLLKKPLKFQEVTLGFMLTASWQSGFGIHRVPAPRVCTRSPWRRFSYAHGTVKAERSHAFLPPRVTSCVQHSITPLLPHCWQ